ncbi:MAG: hypothetical protein ACI4DO_09125 [Roseburia sp.]
MQNREISLSLLFWKIVKGWRVWVAVAVICAVLLPLAQYGSAMANYRSELQIYEATMNQETAEQTAGVTFTKEEQQQIEEAARVKMLLAKNQDYAKNAVLMNIDPYQEQVLTLTYCVDTHYVANYMEGVEQNYTLTLLSALASYANNGLDQTKVWGEDADVISEKHLTELVGSSVSSGNTFYITVIYTDEETLHTVADNIKPLMEAKAQELSDSITDFDLILASEDYEVRESYELAVKQQNVQNAISNYSTSLTNLTDKMTEEQLNYLEMNTLEEGENIEEMVPVLQAPVKPSFHIMHIIVGAMVGIFLAVFTLTVIYIFSGKIHSSEELMTVFRLRQFGVIRLSAKKKGLDGVILKLQNGRRKQLSAEATVQLAASNVLLYCKKENINQLYLTGTEIEKLPKDIVEKISIAFRESGIRILYGENLNYDAASLKDAVDAGNVLLVEQTEVSLVFEIEQAIRVLQDQGVNIVGCIGVE